MDDWWSPALTSESDTPPLDTYIPRPLPAHAHGPQQRPGPYARPSTDPQATCTGTAQPQQGKGRWQFHPDCWGPQPPPFPTAAMLAKPVAAEPVAKWAPRPHAKVPAVAKSRTPLPRPKACPSLPIAIAPVPANIRAPLPMPEALPPLPMPKAPPPMAIVPAPAMRPPQPMNAASSPATIGPVDPQATLADMKFPPRELWTNFHYICIAFGHCQPPGL